MRRVIALIALAFSLNAQHKPTMIDDRGDARLPNGKSQQDEILKLDHEKDIADARELARLATELREEVEKGDAFVMSVATLKKTDEIEKITKRIRSRIRRY
jgi:hypothetical protein